MTTKQQIARDDAEVQKYVRERMAASLGEISLELSSLGDEYSKRVLSSKYGVSLSDVQKWKNFRTPWFQDKLRECPVIVETGTREGYATEEFAAIAQAVYSVELSPEFAAFSRAKFTHYEHVTIFEGDSAVILPVLCQMIRRPVCFYLDAHWYAAYYSKNGEVEKQPVAEDNPMPLREELAAILARPYPDRIFIDDVHAFGRRGIWNEFTVKSILELLGERVEFSETQYDHLFVRLRGS